MHSIFAYYFCDLFFVLTQNQRGRFSRIAGCCAFRLCNRGGVGFYDGFFGPGTGSFFMLVLITLGGFGMVGALAHAKLFNFATNIASMLVFASMGKILFIIGLLMALGQFTGANIGSRMAIRLGAKLIKPFVVSVSLIACINLLWREYF